METHTYDLIVIGGGSGGLTAAIGGAGIGAKVLLIEKDVIGGDCTHHGCVPSKTLIKAARVAKHMREYATFGLTGRAPEKIDIANVLEKVQATVQSIADHETPEALASHNVDAIIGAPKFVDEQTVEVDGTRYTAKRFVIATGSRARVPTFPGIDNVSYMTNKQIFDPKQYSSLAVVGGGPIGCELGQAFHNLGLEVQILNNQEHILGREDVEAAQLVEAEFEKSGLTIHKNCNVEKIEQEGSQKKLTITQMDTEETKTIVVDEVLVAIGRTANIEDLDLDRAGVRTTKRGIEINAKGQSSNPRIYAVGDVAGGMQFTHLANHHGKVALANLIFKLPAKYETSVIPRVTFTTPEVASVGLTEAQLKEQKIDYTVLKKEYDSVDRAITDSNTTGFFKYMVDKKGYILGAVIAGEAAGELIGEIALAMKQNLKIMQIAETIHPYPTYGYGLRNTADLFRSKMYTPNKKKWVKKIFGLTGK